MVGFLVLYHKPEDIEAFERHYRDVHIPLSLAAILLVRASVHAQQQPDQLAPPPGREMEVSIEPDERAVTLRLRERHALVVVDAERQVYAKVDPA